MNNRGTTLIEILISLAIISFLVAALYSALNSMVSSIGEAKQRTIAIAVVNEKMEIMRNLDYEEVGVVNGIINGPMLQFEEVTRNGFNYRIYIDVRYVYDELDGTGENDPINTDYKFVQIKAEWDHFDSVETVEFTSNFVPNGIETDMGGGSLVINSMTSGGDLVGNVSVNLDSIEDNPEVNYTTNTDANGSLVLQGVPSQTYRITLNKSGYESVRTYPSFPESAFIPVNSDFYVNEGYLNSKNFYINPTGNLTIKAVDISSEEAPIAGLSVELSGGQLIGNEPDTYNFNEISSTDSEGEIDYNGISPGPYEILNKDTLGIGDFVFVGSIDETSFDLLAEESKTVKLEFADEDNPSLFLEIIDKNTQEPIEDASVALIGPNNFEQAGQTNNDGKLFFPIVSDPQVYMENGEYNLEIRKNDYSDYSSIVNINNLTKEQVELNPI